MTIKQDNIKAMDWRVILLALKMLNTISDPRPETLQDLITIRKQIRG